jgi:hypothetical protein
LLREQIQDGALAEGRLEDAEQNVGHCRNPDWTCPSVGELAYKPSCRRRGGRASRAGSSSSGRRGRSPAANPRSNVPPSRVASLRIIFKVEFVRRFRVPAFLPRRSGVASAWAGTVQGEERVSKLADHDGSLRCYQSEGEHHGEWLLNAGGTQYSSAVHGITTHALGPIVDRQYLNCLWSAPPLGSVRPEAEIQPRPDALQ